MGALAGRYIAEDRKKNTSVKCGAMIFIAIYTYMCARLRGTMRRSLPMRALPVALIRFSPFGVNGSSVVPVCLEFSSQCLV